MANKALSGLAVVGALVLGFAGGLAVRERGTTATAAGRSLLTPFAAGPELGGGLESGGAPAGSVSLLGVTTAAALMDQLATTFGKPVHTHWEQMTLQRDHTVRFDLPAADVPTVFRLLNSAAKGLETIDYRVFASHVEVATTDYFDRQELTTVSYDVTGLVRAIEAASDPKNRPVPDQIVRTIIDIIQSNVAPEYWADNGGDLGRISTIGSGLMVTVPRRLQPQVAWVMEQMERTPGWTTGLQRLLNPPIGGAAAGTAGGPATGGTPGNGNP